ncbi:hypothetical protein SAMN03080610_00609 [Afifella marina DSM 2698]|uniref:Uncharacterized protein n=1 Tax=Afifella marina DSM 2698 TaxID=1120955 RepID=A0A1G5MGQ5_AFIMA|nr:hypothetical protein SAMN03080610_00609 [Afifella marina DSM 2698]
MRVLVVLTLSLAKSAGGDSDEHPALIHLDRKACLVDHDRWIPRQACSFLEEIVKCISNPRRFYFGQERRCHRHRKNKIRFVERCRNIYCDQLRCLRRLFRDSDNADRVVQKRVAESVAINLAAQVRNFGICAYLPAENTPQILCACAAERGCARRTRYGEQRPNQDCFQHLVSPRAQPEIKSSIACPEAEQRDARARRPPFSGGHR